MGYRYEVDEQNDHDHKPEPRTGDELYGSVEQENYDGQDQRPELLIPEPVGDREDDEADDEDDQAADDPTQSEDGGASSETEAYPEQGDEQSEKEDEKAENSDENRDDRDSERKSANGCGHTACNSRPTKMIAKIELRRNRGDRVSDRPSIRPQTMTCVLRGPTRTCGPGRLDPSPPL